MLYLTKVSIWFVVIHYTRDDLIEQEAPYTNDATSPPTAWPTGGSVEFRNVTMSYRPGLPTVLRDLSFSVRDKEKIGVVGRTGAGKVCIPDNLCHEF